MRAVVQRVLSAKVVVAERDLGEIERGLLVFLGVENGDTEVDLNYLFNKVVGLRIFEDEQGKMNRDLGEVNGGMLVVSQFTLLGDCRKGRRPSFVRAATPEVGNRLYRAFVDKAKELGVPVAEGKFQADMKVHLINDGPVTIMLDSRRLF